MLEEIINWIILIRKISTKDILISLGALIVITIICFWYASKYGFMKE